MKFAIIGGHFTPALAVIDTLPKEAEVVFIGRKYAMEGDTTPSLEYKTITARNIPFEPLTTGRLQRQMHISTALSLMKLPLGIVNALRILHKHKPDVVVGFGGYLSVPVCLSACILGIPIVIHEQTLEAGLANKLLAPFAQKVCISWKQSAHHFSKGKTVFTGNPIRKFSSSDSQFLKSLHFSKEDLPLLYITGGSTGAHAINMLIESCLEELLGSYRIIHQTGNARQCNDFERLDRLRSQMGERFQHRYLVTTFVSPEEVGGIMKTADLIITRSGMNTVTELLYFGKMTLCIPLPYGQKNEQLTNAQFMKKVGIGEYLLQKEVTPQRLVDTIKTMLSHKHQYTAHSKEAKQLIHIDAPQRIIKIAYEAANKKR